MIHAWEQRLGVRRVTLLLSVPLGLAAAVLTAWAFLLPGVFEAILSKNRWIRAELTKEGIIPGLVTTFEVCLALFILVLLAGFVIGLVRRLWAVRFLRFCYILSYVMGGLYIWVVTRIGDAVVRKAGIDPELKFDFGATDTVWPFWTRVFGAFDLRLLFNGVDQVTVFKTGCSWTWVIIAALLVVAALHITSFRRSAMAVYRGFHNEDDEPGDVFVESVRTHGRDPAFRKRLYFSIVSHLMVFVIIPWLLQFWGCVTPYRVPKGSGTAAVLAVVTAAKPIKKKKKTFILSPDSLISIKLPDLDDSEVYQTVEQQTWLTYKATASAKMGRMGKGGGKSGGWPDGMENHLVRFIRLKYDGAQWNDGMDDGQGSDMNFLTEFRKLTGFKCAKKGEAHAIRLLANYPKGYAPPFVYMTGSGNINVSSSDIKVLRDYLFDGGMLFADAGSAGFDSSFRQFAGRLCPGFRLLDIADDDPIFTMPYAFPHGAPPLWHHGGKRALGIKYKDRWIVFYHPGDINDAWKHNHSGIAQEQWEGAFMMGVNIVYYAFSNYLEETRKYRR